jgi:exonuclease V gamma subunit
MTLHLHFSNRHEPLVDSLAAALEATWTDFGAPPPVVVPSPAVAKWIKLRLCERRGALVGLPTPTLEGFLWQALDPDPGMRILRVDALQQALIPLLDETRLASPLYAPVREYLCPQGSIDPKRRCQLAHEVARLFLEYEYNRPSVWKDGTWALEGLDQVWPQRSYFARAGEPESATEAWQRDLHGLVFAVDGPLASTRRLGLPRLHRIRRETRWTPSGGAVMVFGVDKVSHFHRNLLLELSASRDIHLFLSNPCAEFWEDVDTSRRGGRKSSGRLPRLSPSDYQASELSGALYPAGVDESDPFLLRRWGRSARESLLLWSQAADYGFDFPVEPPLAPERPATVLATLQQALLQRHPGPAVRPMELEDGRILSQALPVDGSVVMLECPERGREMEAVRDRIFDWLEEDPARKVSDAVVLLPGTDPHRTAIHRVFGAHAPTEPSHLPWVVLGEPAGQSRWARAVRSLLALARGQADRPGVFAILRNRLVQEKLRIDSPTVSRWEAWAELSGMIRGWDAAHRRELGDAPEAALDTHTFRAGWMRLQLAPLAQGAFALGLKAPGDLPEHVPVVRDFEADPVEVDVFGACLERLFHEARAFSASCRQLSPTALAARFAAWVDGWIGFDDDAEARVRRDLLEGLEHLSIQESAGRDRIGLDELEEIVVALLSGELPGNARAFAGALTFAPLRSGHILPHGLVVLAGFDAGAFPGDGLRTRLDLLATAPLVGDADPVRDNRGLFLQAVLSARSRLVATWRGRDIQRDERLEPSSALQELEEALRGVSEGSFRHKVRLLARDAALPGEEADTHPSWDPLDRVAPIPPREAPWIADADPVPASVRWQVADVKSFLDNSFFHHARRNLGWRDEKDPGTLDASHEVLEATKLDESIWKSELLPSIARAVWNGGIEAVDGLSRVFAAGKSWDGAYPEAAMALAQTEGLAAWAAGIVKAMETLKERFPGHRLVTGADLSLGDSAMPAEVERLVSGRRVSLAARIPCALVSSDPSEPAILLHCAKTIEGNSRRPASVPIAQSFGTHLVAMALAAAGRRQPVLLALFGRDAGADLVLEPARTAPEPWLDDVLADMLEHRSQYLPGRTLLELGSDKIRLEAVREALEKSQFADPLEELFAPLLPGEADGDEQVLSELARRRLAPFLGGADGD